MNKNQVIRIMEYIFNKNNKIFELTDYPEDYGSLPEWVEIRKEDYDHSFLIISLTIILLFLLKQ